MTALTIHAVLRRLFPFILVLLALGFALQYLLRDRYNDGFNRGYEVARIEGQEKLDAQNIANRAAEIANEKIIRGYETLLDDREVVRLSQEKIIRDQIVPAIERQPDCKFDPEILAGINAIRKN